MHAPKRLKREPQSKSHGKSKKQQRPQEEESEDSEKSEHRSFL